MENPGMMQKAAEVMISVSAAIRNLRLYPMTSDSTRNAVGKAHHALQDALELGTLEFAESNRSLMVCGQPLSSKDKQKPHVAAISELMVNFSVKTLIFKSGIEQNEVIGFLEAVSGKPDEVFNQGGLASVLKSKGISHINASGEAAGDSAGAVSGKGGGGGREAIKEMILPMIGMLEQMLDASGKEKIARHLAKHIASKEDDIFLMVLPASTSGELGKMLFSLLVSSMDDDRFERLVLEIKKKFDSGVVAKKPDEAIKQTYQNMLGTEKGRIFQVRIKEKQAREKAEKEKQQKMLQTGLNAILKGETASLADRIIVESLPGTIEGFYAKDKANSADVLITKIGEGLLSKNAQERFGAAEVIANISDSLLTQGREQILIPLSHKLTDWLKTEKKPLPHGEKISTMLHGLAKSLAEKERIEEYQHIKACFNHVYSGLAARDEAFQKHVGELLKTLITDDMIDPHLEEFRTNANKGRKEAQDRLIELGAPAAEKLLSVLKESNDRFERMRILNVIGEMGSSARPGILRDIGLGEPWYYMRNLVMLTGKVGTEDELEILIGFLNYKDYRVQREAVGSIFAIGGDYREDILMTALPNADDRLKVDIVNNLSALDCEEAVPVFIEMLESKVKDEIAERVCMALGNIGSTDAIPALSTIIEQKKKGLLDKGFSDKVKAAASSALSMISRGRSKPRKERRLKKFSDRKPPETFEPSPEDIAREKELLASEKQIDEHIAKGDTSTALQVLLELIEGYCEIKSFLRADALSSRIMTIDSMALSEMQKAEQIIDQGKTQALNQDYLNSWSRLYTTLNADETNQLYFSLKKMKVSADEVLIRQGDVNSRLYFLEFGEVQLSYHLNGEDITVKTLIRGDIFGEEGTVLTSNVTCTATAVSDSAISYLDKTDLDKWLQHLPSLESKLRDYCLKLEKISKLLKTQEKDRRAHKRSSLSGNMAAQLLNDAGAPSGNVLKGNMSDVSLGGMSFTVNIPAQTVPQLLNRKLHAQFILPKGGDKQKVGQSGKIVSIAYFQDNAYLVHVKFDKALGQ